MSTFSLATNSSCNMHIAHGGDVHLRDKFITDLNNGKWDNESLDPYCAEFVTLAKESTRPVADLGVGNGFTTKKLLETGAYFFFGCPSDEYPFWGVLRCESCCE